MFIKEYWRVVIAMETWGKSSVGSDRLLNRTGKLRTNQKKREELRKKLLLKYVKYDLARLEKGF